MDDWVNPLLLQGSVIFTAKVKLTKISRIGDFIEHIFYVIYV